MQYGEAYRECHNCLLYSTRLSTRSRIAVLPNSAGIWTGASVVDMKKPISKKFLAMLKPRVPNVDQNLLHQCSMLPKGVVVYCKPLFRDAACVVEYLERYTHRVAIFNHRIVNADHDTVFSSGAIIGTAAVGK